MKQIDLLHMGFPLAGARMLRYILPAKGSEVGGRHVRTLMQRMGIEALYRRARTTKREPGHKILPYLLRGHEIIRPNQVWAMDITYIPMAKGFVYLAVVANDCTASSCQSLDQKDDRFAPQDVRKGFLFCVRRSFEGLARYY